MIIFLFVLSASQNKRFSPKKVFQFRASWYSGVYRKKQGSGDKPNDFQIKLMGEIMKNKEGIPLRDDKKSGFQVLEYNFF